jgi:transposase
MQRRKFAREFKLEAVRMVRERGVAVAQAARDLDVHENVLRKWVKELAADPGHAFPGHGQMKPEQLEIERLRREVARLKAERDILKKPPPTSRGTRYEVRLHREAPRDLAGGVDVWGARCLAKRLSCLAHPCAIAARAG